MQARSRASHRLLSDQVPKRLFLALIYGLLAVAVAWSVIPLLWAFSASLTPNEKVFEYVYPFSWRAFLPVDFTLEAYRTLFLGVGDVTGYQRSGVLREGIFGRCVLNTLFVGTSTVVLGVLANAMAGFAFGRFNFRGKHLLFALVMWTFMMPSEVTLIPLYITISRLNWLNRWQALILPGLASAMTIFLFRQFFAGISQDLIDAARVDGASWATVFFRMILPLSPPVLITASLMLFLTQWNSFFWPLLVASRPDKRVVQIAITFAQEQHRTLWNQLLAGSVVAALVPILLMLPLQRYYVNGIVGTGVKE
ncbi:MAG: carbohydrate ABC transporter permease [Anaerolineae bacterium]